MMEARLDDEVPVACGEILPLGARFAYAYFGCACVCCTCLGYQRAFLR